MNRPTRPHGMQVKSMQDYLAMLRRRRVLVASIASLVVLAAVIFALALPPVYRASATILIEQQEIPPDLVRSTVSSYADQRIQSINQRVMTRANLVDIIRKYDLYAEQRKTEPLETVVERMRRDIQMKMLSADVMDPRIGRPTQATIAFTLSYQSEHPQLAQKVANEITSLYLNENLSTRRQMASQATHFLTEEANRVSQQISELERIMAEFKEKNVDRLPELTQFNIQLAERMDRELSDVDQNIRAANERRIYLQSQLALVNPRGMIYGEDGGRILGAVDRLKALRAQYIGAAAVYAPDHPDLVRMRKEIASLEAETGRDGSSAKELDDSLTVARTDLAEARKRYGGAHPDIKRLENQVAALEAALAKQPTTATRSKLPADAVDNPAYIQLQAQLQAAESEISSLQRKRAGLEAKLQDLERRVATAPIVEQQYKELSRDYENAWAKYKELKSKQTEATLAESLETERKGERFTLIEPPELPEKPFKPNRTLILIVGLVLAVMLGVGGGLFAESVNNTVRNDDDIGAVFNVPPLAAIPYIVTAAEQRRHAMVKAAVVTGTVLVVIMVAVWVNTSIMPLEVAWYAGLRRLGL